MEAEAKAIDEKRKRLKSNRFDIPGVDTTFNPLSEKRNNKASAEGARLPKEAMLLRDIYKFTKPFLDAFCLFGLISRACQGPRNPPKNTNVDF